MIRRVAKITSSSCVMVYAINENEEKFMGLVKTLEWIEAIGKSWYLHLTNGATLWAEEIEDY